MSKIIIRQCVRCGKKFNSINRNYLGIYKCPKCVKKESCKRHYKKYYEKNKEKIKTRVAQWKINNPEKEKIIRKRALDKFRKEKPERFNELMRNQYHKNKAKCHCRNLTLRIAKRDNWVEICHRCGEEEGSALVWFEIHHELYPKSREEIRRAYKEGLIYYLCKKCHIKVHSEMAGNVYK